MALIECNECGAQVSDKASKCPQCGNPLKPGKAERVKTFFKSKSFIGIICSLVGLAGILVAFLVVHIRPKYMISNEPWFIYWDYASATFYIGNICVDSLNWLLNADYEKLYISECYSISKHWLFVIIGLVFLCIAMKIFFPRLKKVYFIAFIAGAITFTGLNIIVKRNHEENTLKNLQTQMETFKNDCGGPEAIKAALLAIEETEAGEEMLKKELKNCTNVEYLSDMPKDVINNYCNALNDLAIKTWNKPLNGLGLKVYQATYENDYGNKETDRFYVFFKDEKPIKFAKENIIKEWSELDILFLMIHNFE